MVQRRYYFSTRDLLLMAALAALGGVASTYLNAVGDFFQSLLGFAGTTQWAAGLHVTWLILARGLVRKPGAGTVAGLLKGGVELLSGNTHGLLVVLVDVVAGLLVDLGFLPFRRPDRLSSYILAGGLSAASNVLVFQLFAALPADVLAYLGIVGAVALASGVLLGGLLGYLLVNALRRAGVVRDQQPAAPPRRRICLAFLGAGLVVAAGLGLYLHLALRGTGTVSIGGAVAAPYDYPRRHGDIAAINAEGTLREVTATYTGVPLRELLARAQPRPDAALVLVHGADGYAFFLSMAEVQESGSLLLAPKGHDGYDLVGAANSKAWVRDVVRLTVTGPASLQIGGALEKAGPFDPAAWQFQMDSANLDVGLGRHKYQGVALGPVLRDKVPRPGARAVAVYAAGRPAPALTLPLEQVLDDQDLRLFLVIGDAEVSFALARMGGEVLVPRVERIEVYGSSP